MEIPSLKSLLNSINHLFHLASRESICELALKFYSSFEEILRLLKPILDAIVDSEISSNEMLQTEFVELRHCIGDVRDMVMNFQPLMSKFHFVIEVESLMEKVRGHGIQILELLQSNDHSLPGELSSASLEHCVQKIKNTGSNVSSLITEAIKGHMHSSGATSENLANIADTLSLKSNQELLIEAVALEKLKENAELAEKNDEVDFIDQMINLVTHMHELLVLTKQSETYSHVSIPPDFCCPLSLELMTDPVIVASGQTYEKAFIRRWIDLGLIVCPKTRQTLAHTNLIPNYTVKALISNWCESNNVKLPDPQKSTSLNQSLSLAMNFKSFGIRQANSSSATDLSLSPEKPVTPSDVSQNPRSPPQSSCAEADVPGNIPDTRTVALRNSVEMSEHSGEATLNSDHAFAMPSSNGGAPSDEDQINQGYNRMNSGSSTHSITSQGKATDEGTSHRDAYSSDVSGDLSHEPQAPANQTAPTRESIFPSRDAWGSQSFWRSRKFDRFVPRVVNCPNVEPEFLAVEKQVKKLVEDLKSDSVDDKRKATYEIRLLARHSTDNRIIIANCGAINLLVGLLRSSDMETQENAVTALLNLSINDNNKDAIGKADAIEPLIYVLQTGSSEAKENAAATLFSLSVTEENKIKIGKSGAIEPLVDLLENGTPRGKKDAATALFNLSINHENKAPIVQAGAVRHLIELMDPRFGMVDKAVGVLSNLSTITEGRKAIGQEGGIPFLVEAVELGSAKGKENAAAALLQLCTTSSRCYQKILEEGAVPPLVALSRTGTPRAKEKANLLIDYIRRSRHDNAVRN